MSRTPVDPAGPKAGVTISAKVSSEDAARLETLRERLGGERRASLSAAVRYALRGVKLPGKRKEPR